MNPIITYFPNGNKKYEEYRNHLNQLHNKDKPAVIIYYKCGSKFSETYFLNGKNHNVKGPAYIGYDEDGSILDSFYYLNGERIFVNSYEEFQKYIKRLNIS